MVEVLEIAGRRETLQVSTIEQTLQAQIAIVFLLWL